MNHARRSKDGRVPARKHRRGRARRRHAEREAQLARDRGAAVRRRFIAPYTLAGINARRRRRGLPPVDRDPMAAKEES